VLVDKQRKNLLLLCAALAAGASLWLGTAAVSGRREAWDSPLYWSVAYPLCIALAALFGYLAPEKTARWSFAVMLVQPIAMLFASGGDFALLPLGLILFVILALPAFAAAKVAASVRLRSGARADSSTR
jgi:hypothetical protein